MHIFIYLQSLYFLFFYLFCPEASLLTLTSLGRSNNFSDELGCTFIIIDLEVIWEYTNKF